MSLDPHKPLSFSPLHRLQWEEAQRRHVILYPEGLVELNDSAAEILKLCDGTRSLAGIVESLEAKFGTTGLTDDIREMVEDALAHGWIKQP